MPEFTADLERYISTSVADAKSSLECMLTHNPISAANTSLALLNELYGVPSQTSRRRMVAGILRRAATKLAEE